MCPELVEGHHHMCPELVEGHHHMCPELVEGHQHTCSLRAPAHMLPPRTTTHAPSALRQAQRTATECALMSVNVPRARRRADCMSEVIHKFAAPSWQPTYPISMITRCRGSTFFAAPMTRSTSAA